MRALVPFSLLAAIATTACQHTPPTEPKPTVVEPIGTGVDEAVLDPSTDPCTDFYQYACGAWMKATPIPEDRSGWTRSFSEIDERNLSKLRDILEGRGTPLDAYASKVKDFYNACMDEEGVEKLGLKDLTLAFETITKVKDKSSLAEAVRVLDSFGFDLIFDFSSGQDFADATTVIGQIDQAGLGLPDRDYYTRDTPKDAEIRLAYEEHIGKMLELSGLSAKESKERAHLVYALEFELATVSMIREDLRDPKKVYHRINAAELKKIAPSLNWDAFLQSMNVALTAPINLAQPKFLAGVEAQFAKTSPEAWQAYLRWHVLAQSAPYLSKAFVEEAFRFKSRHLTGQKQNLPRWKRCVNATDQAIGEALAGAFVKGGLGDDGKRRAKELVERIEAAMERDLTSLTWMDDPTRKKAFEKLHKINNKIGFPSMWRSYDTLAIDRGSYLRNVLHASVFERARKLAKIGKPLDRGEWLMTPPTVNAYYDANMNEMVFPAGILQAPFFDKGASIGMNYGAIGMVMGHELTHGFDDEGAQFDGDGNLKNWWSPEVGKEFENRTACLIKQYDGYIALTAEELRSAPADESKKDPKANAKKDPKAKPVEDLHVIGKLTLGENIADLGGIKLAFAALREASKDKSPGKIGQFSAEQQFFLSFAQAWCSNTRPEEKRVRATTDPHSPPRFRVNGPLSDFPEFAATFQCKPGSPMAPTNRCEVW